MSYCTGQCLIFTSSTSIDSLHTKSTCTARNRMWESSNPKGEIIQPPSHPDGPCPSVTDQRDQFSAPSFKSTEKQWRLIRPRNFLQWPLKEANAIEGFTIDGRMFKLTSVRKCLWQLKGILGGEATGGAYSEATVKALLDERGICSTGTEMGSENSSL